MDDKSIGLGTTEPQTAGTCATCRRPLTQCGPNGECLRCLVSLGFLADGEQVERPVGRGRLTPGLLRYAHFEVEVGADGFPVELGTGAMAITYRARDTVLNSTVALKVINRSMAQNPGARSRFLREARAAANIHHPNVARVTYYGEQDGECFYAMELVEGETLEARVRRDGPMPFALALEVIEQAARALAVAEVCGVVHRDIKPSNIMLESDPSETLIIKVIDYGVAKVMGLQAEAGAEQTQAGFIGTPAFASPEQFAGAGQSRIDTRSDIYSLGVTLWYLLSGRTPFVGRTMEEIRARQTSELPFEQLRSLHLPGQVVTLLKSMLASDPKDRPQTARELLSAVHSCYTRFNPEARSRRRRNVLAGAALTLAIAAVALGTWMYQRTRPFTPMERSIAVLPFENLSRDPDNAYFAEGIQDEILTRLSKIADLKVISRTSTQHYKSAPDNVPEIARQLGAAHILEGSVQKSGEAVRVNVQLIKAANDSHLWADIFDRKLTDIFSVESDVAKAIADQLRAHLSGPEEQVIAAKPTDNPEAYDAYLRGLAYTNKPAVMATDARKYLKQAVELDPNFALAWALLSYVDSNGYRTLNLPATESTREEARQAAERALTHQPNLGEGLFAKGYYHYSCLKEYDVATSYFEQARRLLPNNSLVPQSLAFVCRRRGQWQQSEAYFNEAEQLDPRNALVLTQHGLLLSAVRRFPDAIRKIDEVLNISPDNKASVREKADITQAEGDLPRAAQFLSGQDVKSWGSNDIVTHTSQAIFERHPAEIIPQLKQILGDHGPNLDVDQTRFWLGWAQEQSGDHAAARQTWQEVVSKLAATAKAEPDSNFLLDYLALTCACLGDKNAALSYARRSMELVPIEKDALSGPAELEIYARTAALTGDTDQAITALQKLLSIPYEGGLTRAAPLTPALLRLDPMFDPLRNDARFQQLIAVAVPRGRTRDLAV